MPVVDFIQRIGGALSGAAAKLLKFRRIVVFDPDDFDVEDEPTATIQGPTSDPGTGTGYTRVAVRAGAGGNVPPTRTLQGSVDIFIDGDAAAHDLSDDREFTIVATTTGQATKLLRLDDAAVATMRGISAPATHSFTIVHEQHASGAGLPDSWEGQAAATGAFEGGHLQFLGGAGGNGSVRRGELRHGLGAEVSTRSAYFTWYNADEGTPFGRVYSLSGDMKIDSPTGDIIIEAGGNTLTIGAGGFSFNTPPTITGAKGGNAALTSLLAWLDGAGIIVDSTDP